MICHTKINQSNILDLETKDIGKYCVLGKEEKAFMEKVFHALNLSARAYHRTLKVARTIADLDGSETIEPQHIAEAIQYRAVNLGNR